MTESAETLRGYCCPPWCTAAPGQHEADGWDIDGGAGAAIHYSVPFETDDNGRLDVLAVAESFPDFPTRVYVQLGDEQISPVQARVLAENLLRAAAMAGEERDAS